MTNNEMIARWMGLRLLEDGRYEGLYEKGVGIFPPDHLGYDKYYNWLMPVWVKFRDLRYKIDNSDYVEYIDHYARIKYAITQRPINEAFDELVKGIKWYNALNREHV